MKPISILVLVPSQGIMILCVRPVSHYKSYAAVHFRKVRFYLFFCDKTVVFVQKRKGNFVQLFVYEFFCAFHAIKLTQMSEIWTIVSV